MATEDFLEVDTQIGGQNYCCLSFVSPEDVIREKNIQFIHKFLKTIAKNYDLDQDSIVDKYKDFLYINEDKLEEEYNSENDFQTNVRGVKVRGTYSTLKEAQVKAARLQKSDPNFSVYIGQVGYWLPWNPRSDKIDGQEYAEGELNELVKKYRENQENKDLHFRENIDYVKEQQIKRNEDHKNKITEQVNDNLMGSEDAWLQRKNEEALVNKEIEIETEEVQVNAN